MMLFLALAWTFLALVLSIATVAIWQRKEYRWDRVHVYLSEALRWEDVFFRRPIVTKKVIVILLLPTVLSAIFGAILFSLPDTLWSRFVASASLLLIVPVVSIEILCIEVLTQFQKRLAIKAATAKIAARSNLTVIGVTGSYGKTTTKEFIATLLGEKFAVLKTPLHVNTDYTVARVILRDLKTTHDVFVVEMGAYTVGEIASAARMVRPKIGVITGINEQHLALFGSIENTIKAKRELIDALPKDGVAIYNAGDPISAAVGSAFGGKKIPYGRGKQFLQQNLDAAIAVAKTLSLSPQEIARGRKRIDLEAFLTERKGLHGATVLDDSYSSNPSGFVAALEFLAGHRKKRKIVVTPGIIELGSERARIHRALGEKIRAVGASLIVTHPAFAKRFAVPRWIDSTDERKIAHFLKKNLTPEDVLLIEGRISLSLKRQILPSVLPLHQHA